MGRHLVLMASVLVLAACSGTPLRVAPVSEIQSAPGDFNLIYFVGVAHDDIRNAVVVDLLGDEYEFIPTVRDFEYEILQDIKMSEALYEANIFFDVSQVIEEAVFGAILNSDGQVLGYEFRPMYNKSLYGDRDILDISYLRRGKRIYMDIRIRQGLIRILRIPETPPPPPHGEYEEQE